MADHRIAPAGKPGDLITVTGGTFSGRSAGGRMACWQAVDSGRLAAFPLLIATA